MTGQQLKNSILQLAIQGKLVPQDTHDEPASELLKRIRKEKEALVKEGKLKKKDLVVTPISEDEKPFELPEGWEWCRLGEMVKLISGTSYSKGDVCKGGLRILRGGNIQPPNLILNDDDVFLPMSFSDNEKNIKKGDVVIVASTGSFNALCKPAFIRDDYPNTQIGAFLRIIRPTIMLSWRYLVFIILSHYFHDNVVKQAKGININNIKTDYITELPIPLPPLAEQHRIVAKIEELMPLVDEYDKAQKKLDALNSKLPEALKKSILQEAIMGKLGTNDPTDEPASGLLKRIQAEKAKLAKEKKIKKEKPLPEITEEEKPFEIPENWAWCRLGEIFMHSSGKQLKGSDNEGTLKQYITTSNLYWGRFDLDNLKSMYYKDSEIERCTALQGDLLVCEGGDVGRSAIWPYGYPICLQNHVHRLRALIEGYTQYVYYAMMYNKYVGAVGGKGIGIQGLSATALKLIPIPLPPLAEQHRIVEKLEKILPKLK